MPALTAPVLAPGDRVHVLKYGIAQCRTVPGLPYQWPPRHHWVKPGELHTIPRAYRCPHCKETP